MKKYLKKFVEARVRNMVAGLFLPAVLLMLCVFCGGCSKQPQEYRSVDTVMGTIFRQQIFVTESNEATENITGEITACVRALETDHLSRRIDGTEIFHVNALAGQKQKISGELFHILEQCETVKAASGGAFDVSIGTLVSLWDIDAWAKEQEGFVPPQEDAIATCLEVMEAESLWLQDGMVCVPEGMQLDLGAVGKGAALDRVKLFLEENPRVSGAVISAGGSILTYGSKPDGSHWKVAIVDPFDSAQTIGILTLDGQWCVSTSGDYERYVEAEGERYHHILDPHSGRPADSHIKSVTILAKDGLLSDALSTACFVLGVEKGMKLAEYFQVEVLFVNEAGELFMTEGMQQYFRKL